MKGMMRRALQSPVVQVKQVAIQPPKQPTGCITARRLEELQDEPYGVGQDEIDHIRACPICTDAVLRAAKVK